MFAGAGKMKGDHSGIISTVVIVFIFCLFNLGVLVLRSGPIRKLDNKVLSLTVLYYQEVAPATFLSLTGHSINKCRRRAEQRAETLES